MKFRTENEFTHFKFSDVHVSDIMMSFGTFKICLDNVIIKADNSKNRDIRDMRTNGLILKLSDANIISFIREGFKTYDADGNLKSTTADEEIIFQERRYQEKPIFQGLQKLWNAVRCAGIYIECNTYAAGMQQRY